jgi:DNA-binding transcriptional LysR family regulator
MDLRLLRAFVTVARFSSFTKAAEALHLTQPAVSGQLRALEEELEVQLLTRTTASVVLTANGQELLKLAEETIEAFGRFKSAARMRKGIEGRLKIGVVMVEPSALQLGALLANVLSEYPGLTVDLQVARTSWMHDRLRCAEIDAAIMIARSKPLGTQWHVLDQVRFRLTIPAQWKTRFEGTDLGQLTDVPWIRMAQRSAHREVMNELLHSGEVKPRETVEVDHELMMVELVSAGVGVGLLREDLAHKAIAAGGVAFFGNHCVTAQLAFVYSEERTSDPLILSIVTALDKIWKPAQCPMAPAGSASVHTMDGAQEK